MAPEAETSDLLEDNFLGRQLRELGRRLAPKVDAAKSWWRNGASPQAGKLVAPSPEMQAASPTPGVRVEDKLFQNRYLVDAGRAHIKVRPHTVPSLQLLSLLKACPARCYDLNDKGQVEITVDGCVECGTCRIIGEPTGDIEWHYPRGGYGVLFKFG
jgi:ferredoxin like protein